jgi:hypothetical protein
VNVAYKHLDAKLRIADLTIGQWISVLVGIGVAAVWGLYLSPLGTYLTLVSSVYFGALPAAAALLASMSEFDLWLVLRSALRWYRLEGRFASGPGGSAHGYVVRADRGGHAPRPRERPRVRELDPASLWEER